MDNELFELCKEVYEKTEWGKPTDEELTDVEFYYAQDGEIYHIASWNHEPFSVPLYTSDYLLEKLPKTSPRSKDAYLAVMKKNTPKDVRSTIVYSAGFFTGYGWSYNYKADTPLKALLKLVIALNDAGVNL